MRRSSPLASVQVCTVTYPPKHVISPIFTSHTEYSTAYFGIFASSKPSGKHWEHTQSGCVELRELCRMQPAVEHKQAFLRCRRPAFLLPERGRRGATVHQAFTTGYLRIVWSRGSSRLVPRHGGVDRTPDARFVVVLGCPSVVSARVSRQMSGFADPTRHPGAICPVWLIRLWRPRTLVVGARRKLRGLTQKRERRSPLSCIWVTSP